MKDLEKYSSQTFVSFLIHPPWKARRNYQAMKAPAMVEAVKESGHWNPHPDGCSVWMWSPCNRVPDALWALEELGAQYITNVVWVKAQFRADPGNAPAWWQLAPLGLGQRFESGHELLLYSRIGKVSVPPSDHRMPSVMLAPRAIHSEKPERQYDWIQEHDPEGARCEIFADSAQGKEWTCCGHKNKSGGEGHVGTES